MPTTTTTTTTTTTLTPFQQGKNELRWYPNRVIKGKVLQTPVNAYSGLLDYLSSTSPNNIVDAIIAEYNLNLTPASVTALKTAFNNYKNALSSLTAIIGNLKSLELLAKQVKNKINNLQEVTTTPVPTTTTTTTTTVGP